MLKKDLGKVLLKLEELQEAADQEAARARGQDGRRSSTEEQSRGARRCSRTRSCSTGSPPTSTTCGLVGEHTNKLVGYLAAVSRKLDQAAGGDGAVARRRPASRR